MIRNYDRYSISQRPGVVSDEDGAGPAMRRNDNVSRSVYDVSGGPSGQSLLRARRRSGMGVLAKPIRDPNYKELMKPPGVPAKPISNFDPKGGMSNGMPNPIGAPGTMYPSNGNTGVVPPDMGTPQNMQTMADALRQNVELYQPPVNPMNTRMGGGFGSNLGTRDGSNGRPPQPVMQRPDMPSLMARRRAMPRNPGAPSMTVMPTRPIDPR